MAVAYFQFHWKFQLGPKFFPVVNQGELAALDGFVFLFIAGRGGVKWSLDKKDQRQRFPTPGNLESRPQGFRD